MNSEMMCWPSGSLHTAVHRVWLRHTSEPRWCVFIRSCFLWVESSAASDSVFLHPKNMTSSNPNLDLICMITKKELEETCLHDRERETWTSWTGSLSTFMSDCLCLISRLGHSHSVKPEITGLMKSSRKRENTFWVMLVSEQLFAVNLSWISLCVKKKITYE